MYSDCGTACPDTCDNLDEDSGGCIAVCVSGMHVHICTLYIHIYMHMF